jgi:ATP-dependent DNA ligase
MSKRDVELVVKPWRGVDWNEKAVAKRLEQGSLWMGPKVDGVRLHLIAGSCGEIIALSRAGKKFPALGAHALIHIGRQLDLNAMLYGSRALDCELWIDGLPMEKANGRLSEHRDIDGDELANLRIMVFDAPTVEELQGLSSTGDTLHRRRSFANAIIKHGHQISLESLAEVRSLEDIEALYEDLRLFGYEGGMVKDSDLPYRNGKVSGIWKRKPKINVDGVITGYVWGEPDKANAGKIVGFQIKLENGVTIRATGLTVAQMDEFTFALELDPTAYIGRQAEATAMEYTAAGALRHPSFKRFRDLDTDPGVKV